MMREGLRGQATRIEPASATTFHIRYHINNSTLDTISTMQGARVQNNLQKAEKERREKEDSGENKENKVVPGMQEEAFVHLRFVLSLTFFFSRRTTS